MYRYINKNNIKKRRKNISQLGEGVSQCTDLERRSSFNFAAAPLTRLSMILLLLALRRRCRLLLRRLLLLQVFLVLLLVLLFLLGLASLEEGDSLPKSTPLQRKRARPTSTSQHKERDVVLPA